jgi:hypothetical protein
MNFLQKAGLVGSFIAGAALAKAPATVEGYRVGVDAAYAKGRIRTVATTNGAYTLQSEMGMPLAGINVYLKDALSASKDSMGELHGRNSIHGAAFYGPIGVEVSDIAGTPKVTAEGVAYNTLVQGTMKSKSGKNELGARVARAETFGPVTLEAAVSGTKSNGKLTPGIEASGFALFDWGIPCAGASVNPTDLKTYSIYGGFVFPTMIKNGQLQPMVSINKDDISGSLGLRYNF